MRVTLQNTLSFALFFLWKNILDLLLMCVCSFFFFPKALIAFLMQPQPANTYEAKQNQHAVLRQGGKMPSNLVVSRGWLD